MSYTLMVHMNMTQSHGKMVFHWKSTLVEQSGEGWAFVKGKEFERLEDAVDAKMAFEKALVEIGIGVDQVEVTIEGGKEMKEHDQWIQELVDHKI